ncbi:uncharacterized protein DS421_3g79340 [Arachis hypogaea]|nr:uncharacterized protein DS421_3g79340 [Arachis hypogaea]
MRGIMGREKLEQGKEHYNDKPLGTESCSIADDKMLIDLNSTENVDALAKIAENKEGPKAIEA